MQDERSAEDDLLSRWLAEPGQTFGVDDAVDQRRNGDEKPTSGPDAPTSNQCACSAMENG